MAPSPLDRCAVVAPAAWAARSAAPCAPRACRSRARSAAAPTAAGADVVLLARARRRDRRRGRRVARRAARRPLLGRHALAPLAPHEAFCLHPLMTVTARAAPRSPAPAAPSPARTPRALAHRARRSPSALGHGRRRGRRRRPRRLPRRRVDRLELPRHARGRRRAPGRDRRRRPRARSSRSSAPTRRELGRAGAERALTGPIARGDEATVARQRDGVAERSPELLAAVRRAGRRAPRDAGRARSAGA